MFRLDLDKCSTCQKESETTTHYRLRLTQPVVLGRRWSCVRLDRDEADESNAVGRTPDNIECAPCGLTLQSGGSVFLYGLPNRMSFSNGLVGLFNTYWSQARQGSVTLFSPFGLTPRVDTYFGLRCRKCRHHEVSIRSVNPKGESDLVKKSRPRSSTQGIIVKGENK